MRTIDININQAVIKHVQITLKKDDKIPEIDVQLDLYSGEKPISTFSIGSGRWTADDKKFDVPAVMIDPIAKILSELELIATKICNASLARLPEAKVEPKDDGDDMNFEVTDCEDCNEMNMETEEEAKIISEEAEIFDQDMDESTIDDIASETHVTSNPGRNK